MLVVDIRCYYDELCKISPNNGTELEILCIGMTTATLPLCELTDWKQVIITNEFIWDSRQWLPFSFSVGWSQVTYRISELWWLGELFFLWKNERNDHEITWFILKGLYTVALVLPRKLKFWRIMLGDWTQLIWSKIRNTLLNPPSVL